MRSLAKRKAFSVYEFTEEDEAAEYSSRRFLGHLRPRRPDTPRPKSITKFNFRQDFSSGIEYKQAGSPDIHSADMKTRDNSGSCAVDTLEENLLSAEESCGLDEGDVCPEVYGHVQISKNEFQFRGYLTDSLAAETCALAMPVAEFSDDDKSWTADSESPSTTTSDRLYDEGCTKYPVSDNEYSTSKEIEHAGTGVVLNPDYVLCGTNFFTEAQITFSSDCLKITCFDDGEHSENLVGEWELSDIVHMNIQWSVTAETVHVEIYLCVNGEVGAMEVDADRVDDSSSIKGVTFAIHGRYWLEKEPKILSLTERYRKIWNSSSGDEYGGDDVKGSDMCLSRQHLTELEPFEEVVYPKGDPDAVSISMRDIELLQPDTFINDTIIDFYIKYLKNKLHPEDNKRFHFFNSFFFRKLADLDKDRGSALRGQEAFRRVRKWTRKVDIFEKDYIFIPVNYNLHWSLLVICHPGEVAEIKENEGRESAKLPCVLHMDSIRGNHTDLSDLIRSYLWEEWKERHHPDSCEDRSSKFFNLRFLPLELPQQENSSDCGLFLLHYVELFLEEAPLNFSPSRITTFTNFLNVDWFEPSEASHKRYVIRKLIYDLTKDVSQSMASTSCSNQNVLLDCPEEDIEQEAPVKFLPLQSDAVNKAYYDSDHCFVERENDDELIAASPVCKKESHKTKSAIDFLKSGVNAMSYLNHQDHPLLQNGHGIKCKSSFEEDAVICKQPAASTENADGFVFVSSSISHTSKALCLPKSAGAIEMLMVLDSQNVDGDSLSNSLDYHSIDSSEGVENCGSVPDSPTSTSREQPEACIEQEFAEVDSPVNDVECCKHLQDDVCSSPVLSDKEDTDVSPSKMQDT